MEQGIKEKIERFKEKAETFLKNDIQAFIKDINDNYYFCDILSVGELKILIYNFAGKRQGKKDNLYWPDIVSLEEYIEKEEVSQ